MLRIKKTLVIFLYTFYFEKRAAIAVGRLLLDMIYTRKCSDQMAANTALYGFNFRLKFV